MNKFQKWLDKNRRASDEKKHKTALTIALAFTLCAVYFIFYNWYSIFMRALNPEIKINQTDISQIEVEDSSYLNLFEDINPAKYLDIAKNKFTNIFINTQTVNRDDVKEYELNLSAKNISINNFNLEVYIADADASREQGLSELSVLPKGKGMLFVFDTSEFRNFWMKNMNFPIDIIWINESGYVVGIESDARPDSFDRLNPEISKRFVSPSEVKYVLEINHNENESAKTYGIEIGSKIDLSGI